MHMHIAYILVVNLVLNSSLYYIIYFYRSFFDNIGAITLYAMFGTIISTFVVGYICFFAAKIGLIKNIDSDNPMEALIFGSLISGELVMPKLCDFFTSME